MIDQTGHACLADFGLLTVISDPTNFLASSSYTQGGTARWMSPERIAPQRFGFKDGRPTKHSDCYALGMVIYETIRGKLPFHKHADMLVFMKVVEGERPPRGVRFTKSLWEVLERCWAPNPNNRPSVEGILQCLEMAQNLSEPPLRADGELEEDGDESDSTTDSSDIVTWTSDVGPSLADGIPPSTAGGYGPTPPYQSHGQNSGTIAEPQRQLTNAMTELNPASSAWTPDTTSSRSISTLLNPPSQNGSSYLHGAPGPVHLSNHPPFTDRAGQHNADNRPNKSKGCQCTFCGKWFPRPSGLATHMNSHSGMKREGDNVDCVFVLMERIDSLSLPGRELQ